MLTESKHPDPLIYMKVINSKELKNILKFIYKEEVETGKEELK